MQNGTGVLFKDPANVGQQNAFATALEEIHPKRGFEVAHLLGDVRLRNPKSIGGAAKAAGLRNRKEVTEVANLKRIVDHPDEDWRLIRRLAMPERLSNRFLLHRNRDSTDSQATPSRECQIGYFPCSAAAATSNLISVGSNHDPESVPKSEVRSTQMKRLSHLTTALLFMAISSGSQALAQQFTDVSIAVGFIQEKQKSWGNPIWGDMNNDGYLDLVVPTHGLAISGGPFVYLNNGGESFTDIRATSGIKHGPGGSRDDGDWHGFAFGDYDQDGSLDLYVAEGANAKHGGTNKRDNLFRGLGNGTFEYVSDVTGIEVSMNRGRAAWWLDYDNDGYVDLFVKNYAGLNVLYRGGPGGVFTMVPDGAGLATAALGTDNGSIVSFADYDNDGFMDLMITGDKDAENLYHNQSGVSFLDVTAAAGLVPSANGKGIAWGDYNNDGFLDLFVARGQQGSLVPGASLYRNNGDGTFTDVTDAAGLEVMATCWTGIWGDYDNDGELDLFVTDSGDTGMGEGNSNFLFHNNADGTFTDVAAAAGVAMADGVSLHKGAAWGDYNNDGFLDLIVKDGVGSENSNGDGAKGLHFLFRNNGNSNHFIKLSLIGVKSNRHGLGARVTVSSSNGVAFQEQLGGGGGENASQGSEPLHFGIGDAAEATVRIDWPSGTVDLLAGVLANSTISVTEGSSEVAPPVITNQPRNQRVAIGARAKFVVSASGDPPLAYQWRKNGIEIPGATDTRYQTPPVTAEDDGSLFSVVISNPGGSVTSRDARLEVLP